MHDEEVDVLATLTLAQADLTREERICGVGIEADWLCILVLDRTDDELLARIAGIANSLLAIVVIVVVAFLLTRLLRRFVTRFSARMEGSIEERLDRAQERGALSDTQRFKTRRLQRLQAIVGVMRGAIGFTVWMIALLVIVARLGVPIQPILAGAGLIGIILGFGAQQLVRDVLAGISMLIEDQYGVGDWIEVDGKFGQVERVGLRSTAFRDVDGTVHHVLNGYVQRVGNLSQSWARTSLDVPLALDTDIATARSIIWDVAVGLTQDPVWGPDAIGPPEIWGVQELGPEGLKIRVVIPTKPLRNWDLTRQLRERLKNALQEADIRMPSQLVDVGGMDTGYTLLTEDLTVGVPYRGVVRRTGPDAEDPAPQDDAADEEARDQTTELRIERGPEARPD